MTNKAIDKEVEKKEPTEAEIIIIDFFESLFKNFNRVYKIEEADLSITPESMLEQLDEFYPNTGFTTADIIKLLTQNNFQYQVMPGITIWLISYKSNNVIY